MTLTPDFTVKRDDVGKTLSWTLQDANGAVNVQGFTSTKLFWINLVTDAVKLNGVSFAIPTPSNGVANYVLTAADLDTSGWFKMEAQVFFGTTRKTFPTNPTDPYLIIRVQDDLG